MSGEPEIEQWTDDNIIIQRGEDPQKVFEFIDKEFQKEGRLPLADILGDELPKYMQYLEERTATTREDLELEALEQRADSLERQIRELMSSSFNLLGTPIR